MLTKTHLWWLWACCIGRRTDYALQQASGRYRRVGSAVTLDALRGHVAGLHTMGTYVIDEQDCCHFAVFDADSLDGLVQLLAVQRRLSADGVASALEGSRRGGHLWLFFVAALGAATVRRWLLPYCPVGVEFYPKRDWATWEQPGSLVRVPFGVHRLSDRRYPFLVSAGDRLVPVARRVSESLEWLASVEPVRVPEMVAVGSLDAVGESATPYVAKGAGGTASPDATASIHEWCDQQDALRAISRYVRLDSRGMGCCPFGWHHADGKDSHPSLWVHAPRASGAPCWYCHVWRRGGNLFDFLCVWYGVSARELWRRILAGEQF